ncbi:hypothetical protein [Picrophilus oshimae]|uniref:Uncharacterized protein n=1 Tax=Picrophilus torridus (strain ATCC 700027 / DSM 9790 / JCM 10055 / NBRC 100828 / KAW 2/3) TaxID=1122961 RepID=Q6L0T6_PICTO|nr:hypothetical protein [Picrophilus oshimae]AAT43416.1 hypothetical protein PTO0831 [Picrophilus oshimae DSM 9789]
MVVYVYRNGAVYDGETKIADITRTNSGLRTDEIIISGNYNIDIKRRDRNRFEIMQSGAPVGDETRGLKLNYYGQEYRIMGDLNWFVNSPAAELTVDSMGTPVATISKSNGEIKVDTSNTDVGLIYLAFLSPYASPVLNNRYYRRNVSPAARYIPLLILLIGLVFISLSSYGYLGLNYNDGLYIFFAAIILSYAIRFLFFRRRY